MFSGLKFAAVLLLMVSATGYAQTTPENSGAGDQSAAAAVTNTDTPETSVKPSAGVSVQFDARMLTISARAARLSDLFSAIGERTGVTFDLPDSLADRLVTAEAGPLVLRDALTSLLKQLELGYGISGDPAQPETVERVVVTGLNEAGSSSGGNDLVATKSPEEPSDDGMTSFEIEEMLAQKAVEQNRSIEKNLADAEAERQAQIASEDFGGKPPEPDKIVAPARKRAPKKTATPTPQ
jgi:hypothetical protein